MMKTIRVQLHGGLGNQLFIWATAHDLVKKYNCKVKLVYISDGQQRLDRPLEMREIGVFCDHSISISTSKFWGILFKLIDKINSMLKDRNTNFGKLLGVYSLANAYDVLDKLPTRTVMIRGYFQDSMMVDRVSQDLALEISKTLKATEVEEKFVAKQSLHIRRGDTTSIATSWGILSLNYFDKSYISNQKTVVCTDSREIQEIYSLKYPNTVVSTNAIHNSWQTLKILAQADRFIGSNSTLSWWAAWLVNHEKKKMAILPDPWRPHDQKATVALIISGVSYQVADFEEMNN
jgi:hypothetical protein